MNESTEYSKGYAAGMSAGYIEGHKDGKVDGAMTAASAYVKSPVTERTAEFRNVHLSYDGDDDDTWECSACQQAWIIDGNPTEHHYHYCPNCGARFKEVSDDKE